jgi:hypothetical protein
MFTLVLKELQRSIKKLALHRDWIIKTVHFSLHISLFILKLLRRTGFGLTSLSFGPLAVEPLQSG